MISAPPTRSTMRTLRRLPLLPTLLVVALLATLSVVVGARAVGGEPEFCQRAETAATARRSLDTGPAGSPAVVVIGDSYSVGAGIADQRDTWPTRLPGRVHVDGFSGSGFSADASPCGTDVSYAERAARAVDGRPEALVVVEGGLNDHDRTNAEITVGFERLMRALAGHDVLVVGPATPPRTDMRTQVPRVDALLADLAADAGVEYLSVAALDLTFVDDDVHPDEAGHATFGEAVGAEVAALLG